MSLLFDNNLSPDLVLKLRDIFPGSRHVMTDCMDAASDEQIWHHAKRSGLTIVSKDWDFLQICQARGFPPALIWIRSGNGPSDVVEALLRSNAVALFQLLRGSTGIIQLLRAP